MYKHAMRYAFLIFVTVASLIVIAAHAGVYFTCVKLFHLESGVLRRSLFWILAGLSVSFITTALLVHWQENLVTRMAYLVSSVWIGAFVHLLLACVAAWIVAAILRVVGMGGAVGDQITLALVLLAALSATVYSLWNAAHPVVKPVGVQVRDLPDQWVGRKIVQLSDVHIGAILREGFLAEVVRKTNEQNPDLVVITGDLFDGAGLELGRMAQPLNELRPPLGTFFITGNHETYVGVERSLSALDGTRVRVLRDEIVEIDGIQLVGIDYPLMGQRKNLDSILTRIDRERPCILLYHEPAYSDTMKALGIDLQLAGHTHRGQMWPFNYITKRVYRGHDYGLHTDSDYNLYTSCGVGTWGPPLRSGNRPEIVVFTLQKK